MKIPRSDGKRVRKSGRYGRTAVQLQNDGQRVLEFDDELGPLDETDRAAWIAMEELALKGTVRLQVVEGNTQYGALRESSARSAHLRRHQINAFRTNLEVAKWDRIGLRFSRHTTLGAHQDTTSETHKTVFFRPPLVVGGPWRYEPSETAASSRLLFNATIKR